MSDQRLKTHLPIRNVSYLSGKNLSVLESKKLSAHRVKTYLPVRNVPYLSGKDLSVLESKKFCARPSC